MAWWLAWILGAQAAPLELVLYAPGDQPAPSTRCDGALCAPLLAQLKAATSSIDFAIYGLRGQPEVLAALVAAQHRGVRVRGFIDRTLSGANYYDDTEALVAALGTVRDDLDVDRATARTKKPYDPSSSRCWLPLDASFRGPRQCVGYDLGERCLLAVHASEEELSFEGDIMHHKFFVVDGHYVWTGSTNVSDSCAGGYNANLVVQIDNVEVARWYTEEFEALYSGRAHGQKVGSEVPRRAELAPGVVVQGLFSPQDRPLTSAVVRLIDRATTRIDVAVFFLTHKVVAERLIAAHLRGVKVRVLVDGSGATNGYTKIELLRAAGVPVVVEAWGGKMHMKAAAIDGSTVIAGSMNWTSAGEWGNDENTLLIQSRTHAEAFHAWFERTWQAQGSRWATGRPDPESAASGRACTDGIDNDHDGAVDRADAGCGPNPPPLAALPPHWVVPKGPGVGLVIGDVDENGRKRALTPLHPDYADTVVVPQEGDRWFCSVDAAKGAGFWPR